MLRQRRTITDAALIAASLTDVAAFAEVFDRHWPAIHRWCVGRAGPSGEDVAAETFRVAFDRRARFDPRYDDARPWLYGIATNLDPQIRAGVMRLLATVPEVRIEDRGAALEITNGTETLTVDAATGVPLRLTARHPDVDAGAPPPVVDYTVRRVVAADLR